MTDFNLPNLYLAHPLEVTHWNSVKIL